MSKEKWIPKLISFIFLAIMGFVWIVPLVWGFFTSFKSQREILTEGFNLLPISWVVDNYATLLQNNQSAPLVRWFGNSMVISVSHTIIVLVIVSLAAFAYSRLEFRGKNVLFMFLMATMMFPQVVNLIPLYVLMDRLGWVNTPLAMIFPNVANVFNIFLVRQFMQNIPIEYDESARIDGASDFTIYFKIILPLIRPVLLVVALFSFTQSWNDFLWPSIVVNDINSMPITPGLQLLQGQYQIQPGILMAGALIAVIPTLILYMFAQKYFLESMSLSSGVKG